MKDRVDVILNAAWRTCRDGFSSATFPHIHGMIFAYESLGLLTVVEAEGWRERLKRCPGHDDEGGRSWCAYCGQMPTPAGE